MKRLSQLTVITAILFGAVSLLSLAEYFPKNNYIKTSEEVYYPADIKESHSKLTILRELKCLPEIIEKDILLAALDIDKENKIEGLNSLVSKFNSQFDKLGSLKQAHTKFERSKYQKTLNQIEHNWRQVEEIIDNIIIGGDPGSREILSISNKNNELHNSIEVLLNQIYNRASSNYEFSDQLVEDIKFLSQKLTKEYLLIAYGYEVNKNRMKLNYSLMEMENKLHHAYEKGCHSEITLYENYSDNNLSALINAWSHTKPLFEAAIKGQNIITDQLRIVAMQSNQLYCNFNEILGFNN
jgi:hypothetical protein